MNLYPADNVIMQYHDRQFMVPSWLEPLLPSEDELPLAGWPTYCGAGDSIGDKIVPDKISGIVVAPCCLVHDVGWATAPNTRTAFVEENWRFRHNLVNWVVPHVPGWRKTTSWLKCYTYWLAVSVIGQHCFHPVCENWATNDVVFEKLKRLNRACVGIV